MRGDIQSLGERTCLGPKKHTSSMETGAREWVQLKVQSVGIPVSEGNGITAVLRVLLRWEIMKIRTQEA